VEPEWTQCGGTVEEGRLYYEGTISHEASSIRDQSNNNTTDQVGYIFVLFSF
jgi:hypothetical protein